MVNNEEVTGEGEVVNKGGRPPKFDTPEELAALIDNYFQSCFEPVMDRVLTEEGKAKSKRNALIRKDKESDEEEEGFLDSDYKWVQREDWKGDKLVKQVDPFTITGLAMSLGIDRHTLINYATKEEFFTTIKAAKTKIENYTEKELFRDKNVTGVIFNLKNNYNWQDKTIQETDPGAPIKVDDLPLDELKKRLNLIKTDEKPV